MNGIKMSDCKFYVDDLERVIVCVIPKTKYMVLDFICDHFDFPDINLYDGMNSWNKLYKELEMPSAFIGKAKCAPEDEWDVDTGMLIAFSRAKDKCYKSFFKRANKFIQAIDRRLGDAISIFNDFGLKLEEKKDNLKQQIADRMPSEDEK